jgi:hypothetical protein
MKAEVIIRVISADVKKKSSQSIVHKFDIDDYTPDEVDEVLFSIVGDNGSKDSQYSFRKATDLTKLHDKNQQLIYEMSKQQERIEALENRIVNILKEELFD